MQLGASGKKQMEGELEGNETETFCPTQSVSTSPLSHEGTFDRKIT
jgi:hypothetical protein